MASNARTDGTGRVEGCDMMNDENRVGCAVKMSVAIQRGYEDPVQSVIGGAYTVCMQNIVNDLSGALPSETQAPAPRLDPACHPSAPVV